MYERNTFGMSLATKSLSAAVCDSVLRELFVEMNLFVAVIVIGRQHTFFFWRRFYVF